MIYISLIIRKINEFLVNIHTFSTLKVMFNKRKFIKKLYSNANTIYNIVVKDSPLSEQKRENLFKSIIQSLLLENNEMANIASNLLKVQSINQNIGRNEGISCDLHPIYY